MWENILKQKIENNFPYFVSNITRMHSSINKFALGGDRFIPNRRTTDLEASHFKIVRASQQSVESEIMSPSKREYQRVIQENLGADLSTTRLGIIKPKA